MNRLSVPLCALLMVVFCKSDKKDDPPADKQKKAPTQTIVDVIVARPQTISSQVEANGTVVSNEYVDLKSETSGRLVYLHVPEGNLVKKGTVLARINDADLQAQLAKTKVLLELAQKNEERLGKLLKVNGVNQWTMMPL